jgi:sulfate permease, SulP family
MTPAAAVSPLDLRLHRLLRDVVAGAVVGALMIVTSVSMAALVFTGDLEAFRGHGIGLALIGTALTGLVVSLLSSLPGSSAQVQDAPAAILAVVAAAMVATLPTSGDPVTGFMTAVALIATTTLATGVAFLLVGLFRLGRVVRYLPRPVVGGFVAGTGWLLLTGAIGVMSGVQPALPHLGELLSPDVGWRWLPGLAFGALLVVGTRGRRPTALPGLLVVGVALFFAVMVATGGTPATWREAGLFMGPFDAVDLLRPFDPADLQHVHWSSIARQAGGIATAVLLALLALPLNVAGLSIAVDRRIDVDRELHVAGWGNLLGGAFGGMTAYQGMTSNTLGHRLGTGRRTTGLTAAAVVTMALLAGTSPLSYLPTLIVGGVLAFMGLSFLHEWLVGGYRTLPPLEYAIVVLIVLVIAIAGLIPGVAAGMLLALLLFAVSYGRVDPVKHVLSGDEARSRMRWDAQERRLLARSGDARLVLQLHGFLFFGGAHRLVDRIETRLEAGPIDEVVLEFRRVTDADATAIASLSALARTLASRGVGLVFTDLTPALARKLASRGLHPAAVPGLEVVETLDEALERSERRALANAAAENDPFQTIADRIDALTDDDLELQDLVGHLERIEVAAGDHLFDDGGRLDSGRLDGGRLDGGRLGGTRDDAIYIVATGQVTARLVGSESAVRLETMRGGHIVGAVGFHTGAEWTMSVVADEATTLYRLTRGGLAALTARDPALAASFHRLVARNMAGHLAHLMRVVEALQR